MEKPSENGNKADKDENEKKKKKDIKVKKDLKYIVFCFLQNLGNVATRDTLLRFILNPQAQMKKH